MSVNTEPDPKGGDSAIAIRGKGRHANARSQFEARAGSLAAFRDASVRYPIDLVWEAGNTRAHLIGTVLNHTSLAGTAERSGSDEGPENPPLRLYSAAGAVSI